MAALERVARLSGPLAAALEQDRQRFNARFAQAAISYRRLDAAELSDHLVELVDPLVRAVAKVDRNQVEQVVQVLYDLSLELLGKDLFSRHPEIRTAWLELFPQVSGLLASAPRKLITAVSNAVCNVAKEQPGAASQWLEDMLVIAPLCQQVETYLEAGKVLAWRCGLAHYRESAIQAWLGLPETLATQVLPEIGAVQDRESLVDELRRPWVQQALGSGQQELNLVMQLGGFRGFGGQFIRPPRVAADLNQIYVHDHQVWWTLHADRYGATLKRFGKSPPETLLQPTERFCLGDSEVLSWKQLAGQFPGLSDAESKACDGETLAVTLPHSHRVHLIARGTALLAFESS